LIEKVDTSHAAVKKTGQAFLIAGTVIAAIIFWKYGHGPDGWQVSNAFTNDTWKWFLGGGLTLLLLSYVAYPVMKPIHIAWMKLAFVMGWFMTRVILGIFFYLILTPMSVVMRLFGKDFIDEKMEPQSASYWKKRDLSKFDPKHIEKTF
jgi:hypothetical protein